MLLSTQTYTWQNVSIDGGGFVDGIFYSPTQQNVIYARTDIGGAYKSTNDGQTWSQLLDWVPGSNSANPSAFQMMGVLSLAIDPENANNIYLDTGEYSGTDGWVLASNNAGASFSITNLPFYVGGNSNGRGTGERLAVDPNLGSILFLGSNANGLYQSSNSAGSFTANTAFNTLVGATSAITFVTFDPRSGTTGHASQDIYVGVDSTNAGTNVYETTNGGTSWSELPSGSSGPTGLIPQRAQFDSAGNLYFTFSNDLPPSGSITTGAAYRFNTSNSAWTNISPVVPGATSGDNFGYVGLAIDPEHAGTVVVTSFDRYSYIDTLWRSTNANTSSPTWVALYNNSSAQNYGYGGYDTTRNTSTAPWVAAYGDGIGNWPAAVAINPFNSAQLMYGTGQGLWATNNATSTVSLTAANSWYFPDNGIEFTAISSLAAPASGIPLYSAMGDIGGFAHTTLTSSPAAGSINSSGGSDSSIDFAQSNSSFAAIIGSFTNGGAYTLNSGSTWTSFAAAPFNGASGGTIAVAANASVIVWTPSGSSPYYSTNDGATWTASTLPGSAPGGSTLTGGRCISDRVSSSYFYYYTESSSNSNFIVYVSSNGGKTFALASQTSSGSGNLVANPFVAGDLWIGHSPLYESTNFGASFSALQSSSSITSVTELALGKSAPGQTYAAIYIWGTVAGTTGVFRSDDHGSTWVQINGSLQWGGNITVMAADPSTFGRLYMGFNGRGIIMGNPASTLPSGWSDADINSPGNPGYATNTTTLSSGSTVNTWTVDGGGAGITGTSDQFNFAYDPSAGNNSVSAKLNSLTNNGTGSSQAGVMFRSSTDSNDPFAALLQTSANQLVFEYRSTTGGSVTSTTLSSVSVGSEYLDLVRSGNSFSAYYGTTGTTWTQLGSTITLSAMPSTANAGLAVSADYNPQLASASFSNVQIIAAPAVGAPSVVSQTSTTANLSVTGASSAGASTLSYSWATTNSPSGATVPSFSPNGTNSAAATTVTFHAAGTYTFTVTVADQFEQSTTSSSINVTITATGTVSLNPANPTLISGAAQTFTASGTDQFGKALTGFAYIATGGTINSSTGAFTAGSVGGSFTVTATSGSNSGSTQVSIVPTQYVDSSGNNAYAIDISAGNSSLLQIFVNVPETGSPTYTIPLSQMPSLNFSSGTGNDSLTVDFTSGDPVPTGGISFNGGSGTNSLTLTGPSGTNTASINSSQLTFDSSVIGYSNVSSIAISAGSGNDTLTQTAQPSASISFGGGTGSNVLNVNAGSYTVSTQSIGGLTINDNSTVLFAAGALGSGVNAYTVAQLNLGASAVARLSSSPSTNDRTVVVTSELSINASAQLDMVNNDMIVRGGTLATLNNLVSQGYSGGAWNGDGIISSKAAGDTTHLTAVGIIPASTATSTIYSNFDDQAVGTGDILMRYTYVGDANLDGKVDGSDYNLVDNGFNNGFTGWLNGDFNYSTQTDGSDYTLIDNAFNTQGNAFAKPDALVASSVSNPAADAVGKSQGTSTATTVIADADSTLAKKSSGKAWASDRLQTPGAMKSESVPGKHSGATCAPDLPVSNLILRTVKKSKQPAQPQFEIGNQLAE